MPKQENNANSRIVGMRLTKRDPRPMMVVKTAKAVGNEMFVNVAFDAACGESASRMHVRYSETI